MKLGTVVTHKKEIFQTLILENSKDLALYIPLNQQIKSKQAVNFWFGFKSQSYRESVSDYLVHEDNKNTIAKVLAIKMEYKNTGSTSIIDFCNDTDKIIYDVHKRMCEFIYRGDMVKVNNLGGFCNIQDFSDFNSVVDINEQEMYNYLISGQIDLNLKITSDTIVIENASAVPMNLISSYCELTNSQPDNIQIITSFKQKTLLFTDKDWFKFFSEGIKLYNLKNIIFETTAQDQKQIRSLKTLLEKLDTEFNIFIKTGKHNHKLFKSDNPKIKISFL